MRGPPYCKERCILVSKRVTSPTYAISALSDEENCFGVQDRRTSLKLVEVNDASNQRGAWKEFL